LDHQTRPACRFNPGAPERHGEGVTAVNRAAMKSNRAGMKSLILKRSIIIAGMKTSVSLEDEFWQALKQIAAGFDMPMAKLVHRIDTRRQNGNLSSALRLYVLEHYLRRTKVKRENEAVVQGEVCSPT